MTTKKGPAQTKRRSGTRTRVRLTTAEKVQTIINMMVELKWRAGKSDKLLGARWGMTPNAVRKLAAEASRAVKREMGDPEEWRARLVATVNLIGQKALAAKNYDAAIRSQVAAADMLGLRKTAVEVSGPDRGPIELEHEAGERILGQLALIAKRRTASEDPEESSERRPDGT